MDNLIFHKRIINYENPNDTTSKYYVLQHKLLTNVEQTLFDIILSPTINEQSFETVFPEYATLRNYVTT